MSNRFDIAMQGRIRRQISIEWWLVYFCIFPSVHLWVAHKGVPPWKFMLFFFFLNMLFITHTLSPQPKHEINWKCKWKPATIESSKLCAFFFSFSQLCIRQQTLPNDLFFFFFFRSTRGLTASEGKHSPLVAVAPACLHVMFASRLCTGDDLARPVHQNPSQFGCPCH